MVLTTPLYHIVACCRSSSGHAYRARSEWTLDMTPREKVLRDIKVLRESIRPQAVGLAAGSRTDVDWSQIQERAAPLVFVVTANGRIIIWCRCETR